MGWLNDVLFIGVFTKDRIAKGSFVGIYSGELISDAEADERGQ